MTGSVSYRLAPFGEACGDLSAELGRLHGELLSHSPVALLGPEFLCRFYYRTLPQLGLIFGQVAFIDNRPAGFIVATHDSAGFMRTAIRKHFLRIGLVLGVSVLRNPRRIAAIWEGLQIMRGLPPPPAGQAQGEILSMGVLPEFRSREFCARTRLRIGQDLLAAVLDQIGARGVGEVRVIVDADNLEARLFYSGQGWVPGLSRVPGWRKETVEFLWQRTVPSHAGPGAR